MRKLAVIFPGIGYTADKPLHLQGAMTPGWEERRVQYWDCVKNTVFHVPWSQMQITPWKAEMYLLIWKHTEVGKG